MKKVTKAIKLANALNDEEKAEFLEFFKKEEDKGEVEVTKKQEEKKEEKKEVKQEEVKKEVSKDSEFMAKFNKMVTEFGELKEKFSKSKAFGEKAKPADKGTGTDFDTAFGNLPR